MKQFILILVFISSCYSSTWVMAKTGTTCQRETTYFGFVWANQPGNMNFYTPPRSYQHTSAGRHLNVRVKKESLGRYRVEIPFGLSAGGNVQVTAYGPGSQYCNVGSWFSTSSTNFIDVRVFCFNRNGQPADSMFSALFQRVDEGCSGTQYVWNDTPTFTGNRRPNELYSYAPIVHPQYMPDVSVRRRSPTVDYYGPDSNVVGNANYRANLGVYSETYGIGDPIKTGVTHITAYGHGNNARCQTGFINYLVKEYVDLDLALIGAISPQLYCFDTNGELVDTRFTVVNTIDAVSGNTLTDGYMVVDVNPRSGRLTIKQSYNRAWMTAGGTQVNRIATGDYKARFNGLTVEGRRSNVQVTARKSSGFKFAPRYCKVNFWMEVSNGVDVSIKCFNENGLAADSGFNVSLVITD